MATCPHGHRSGDDEYCDVCGAQMNPGTPAPEPAAGPEPGGVCPACQTPHGTGQFCEVCGHDFTHTGPLSAPAFPPPPTSPPPPSAAQASVPQPTLGSLLPSQPASGSPPPSQPVQAAGAPLQAPGAPFHAVGAALSAVIGADRAHYDEMIAQEGPDAASVVFPPYCPEWSVPLSGAQMRIGRRSRSRGLDPEIDLTGPPQDPGVSHLHAVLLAQPDGTWTLVDPGSANGTKVNGAPVRVNVPVPVTGGDRIHVGAWTVITLRPGGTP